MIIDDNRKLQSITIVNDYLNEMFIVSIKINTRAKNDTSNIDHDFIQNITLLKANSRLRLLVTSLQYQNHGVLLREFNNVDVGNRCGETDTASGAAPSGSARREMDCDKVWSITLCSMQCLGRWS